MAWARFVILSAAKDRGSIAGVAGNGLWSHIEFVVSVRSCQGPSLRQDDSCGLLRDEEWGSGCGWSRRWVIGRDLGRVLRCAQDDSFGGTRMTAVGVCGTMRGHGCLPHLYTVLGDWGALRRGDEQFGAAGT